MRPPRHARLSPQLALAAVRSTVGAACRTDDTVARGTPTIRPSMSPPTDAGSIVVDVLVDAFFAVGPAAMDTAARRVF